MQSFGDSRRSASVVQAMTRPRQSSGATDLWRRQAAERKARRRALKRYLTKVAIIRMA